MAPGFGQQLAILTTGIEYFSLFVESKRCRSTPSRIVRFVGSNINHSSRSATMGAHKQPVIRLIIKDIGRSYINIQRRCINIIHPIGTPVGRIVTDIRTNRAIRSDFTNPVIGNIRNINIEILIDNQSPIIFSGGEEIKLCLRSITILIARNTFRSRNDRDCTRKQVGEILRTLTRTVKIRQANLA